MLRHKYKIDSMDAKIIELLQKDGRIPNKTLSKKLGIAESTVRTRLRRMLDERVVRIVAVSSPFDLGFQVAGNFKIEIDIKKKDAVMEKLVAIKEIWYVVLTTGTTDIDADFIVPSFEDLNNLIFNKLDKIDGIKKVQTSLIMDYRKEDYDWGTAID